MTIRVGVVGAGFIGRDHLAAYAGWPEAEIAGVADVDLERARTAAAPYGAAAFDGLAAMAGEARLDAVSICVPTGLHLTAVREATAAGLHILLEKPMATTLAACDEIARLADAAGITLMLGLTHHFHAELIRARELIAAGRLGTIGLVHDHFSFGETGPWPAWYYARELSGGGELMHDAVHLVDRMEWLLDRPIVEVHGRTSSFVRGIEGVEDAGIATLTFEGGARLAVRPRSVVPAPQGRPAGAHARPPGARDPWRARLAPLPDVAVARIRFGRGALDDRRRAA